MTGEQRLWGSLATGLTILLVGMLISATQNLDMLFYVSTGSTIAFMACSAATNVAWYEQMDQQALVQEQQHVQQQQHLDEEYQQQHTSLPKNINLPTPRIEERMPLLRSDLTTPMEERDYMTFFGHPDDMINAAAPCKLDHALSHASTQLRQEANHTASEDAFRSTSFGHNLGLAVSRISSIDHYSYASHLFQDHQHPSATKAGILENTQLQEKQHYSKVRVVTFLVATLLYGIVWSMVVNFLFLFLSEDLRMPASWMGWTGPVGGLAELVCFYYAKPVCSVTYIFCKKRNFLWRTYMKPSPDS